MRNHVSVSDDNVVQYELSIEPNHVAGCCVRLSLLAGLNGVIELAYWLLYKPTFSSTIFNPLN